MKIQDNSASYPDYSVEQLNEELNALNQAKQTAMTTGTGTEGVENLIQKVTREIRRRNGEKFPTEEEVEQTNIAAKQFQEQQASVPESEKTYLDSPKFDGSIGNPDSIQAQQKAEQLIRKIDPQYTGNFAVNEIPEVGYLVWQDVRGGNSIIVGQDGGILLFNSSVSPEDGIQAYKDGRRTSEDKFNSVD